MKQTYAFVKQRCKWERLLGSIAVRLTRVLLPSRLVAVRSDGYKAEDHVSSSHFPGFEANYFIIWPLVFERMRPTVRRGLNHKNQCDGEVKVQFPKTPSSLLISTTMSYLNYLLVPFRLQGTFGSDTTGRHYDQLKRRVSLTDIGRCSVVVLSPPAQNSFCPPKRKLWSGMCHRYFMKRTRKTNLYQCCTFSHNGMCMSFRLVPVIFVVDTVSEELGNIGKHGEYLTRTVTGM